MMTRQRQFAGFTHARQAQGMAMHWAGTGNAAWVSSFISPVNAGALKTP
jgi:hypothetical protein